MRPIQLGLSIVRNRLGATPRPSLCTYAATLRCNARCRMCDSWKLPRGEEMTPDQAAGVFADVGRLDLLRLTGGEPFLRPDFAELAGAAFRAGEPMVVHVSTNGSMTDRIVAFAETFAMPGRLWFMVSLDGLAEEHDANRGPAVTFDRALDTVRRLACLRDRLGLRVSVNHTVISPRSMADAAALRERLAVWGVEVHAVLAYSDSAMYSASRTGEASADLTGATGYPLHRDLDLAESVAFVREEIRRSRRMRSPLLRFGKSYYLRGLYERLLNRADPRPRLRCVALRSHLRLLPDGRVPVCQFNTQSVGNLRDDGFENVWFGERARQLRRWVDACPGCWAECEVMPSAVYSGDLIGFVGAQRPPAEPAVAAAGAQ
jgi:MoaA/NifB/PqqE/SkfB family radical SAM enzyme